MMSPMSFNEGAALNRTIGTGGRPRFVITPWSTSMPLLPEPLASEASEVPATWDNELIPRPELLAPPGNTRIEWVGFLGWSSGRKVTAELAKRFECACCSTGCSRGRFRCHLHLATV